MSSVQPLLIVGLSGSLSHPSQSTTALRTALQSAAEAGAQTQLLDLADLDIPVLTPAGFRNPPADVLRLCEAVRSAHGLIWASPLYHGGMSGALKNALDWLELLAKDEKPYLTDKVVGLICVAGGAQALNGIWGMQQVAHALRAWVVPLTAPLSQSPKTEEEFALPEHEKALRQLRLLGQEVVKGAEKLSR